MRVRTPFLLLLLIAGGVTGCGSSPEVPRSAPATGVVPVAAARADLAARAAAARDLATVSFYTLATTPDAERSVLVVRAPDGSWRVDISGGTADRSLVSNADGLFSCRLRPTPERAGCVPLDALTPETEPWIHRAFIEWPHVLTDRSAPLAVAAAPALPGVDGDCFSVQPAAASLTPPLDPGTYCYRLDGLLTGAALDRGTLTLTGTGEQVPPSVDLPGPVVPDDPLPAGSPTPTQPPTGSPTPTRRPAGSPTPTPRPTASVTPTPRPTGSATPTPR